MSTEKIGDKLRKLRKEREIPLRTVAAKIGLDVATLSKMERGEKPLTKEIIRKLANLYEQNPEALLVLYLRDRILDEIGGETHALKALQLAEEQLEYRSALKTDRNFLIKKLKEILSEFTGIQEAWIYGSFARKEDGPRSDIDMVLKTDRNFSYFNLADVQHRAEAEMKRKVDVGFWGSFKPEIWNNIKPDLKLIYERG